MVEKMMSGGSGGGLGNDLRPFWLQVVLGTYFGPFWPALEGRKWSQDGPKKREDGPSGRPDGGILRPKGAKKHPREASWGILGSFFADFGGVWGTSL